jgi:hypothetical protein
MIELESADAGQAHAAMPRGAKMTLVQRVASLKRAGLPSLRKLSLRAPQRLGLAVAKISGEILDGLHELVLAGDLGDEAVNRLATALERRELRLPVLDLRGCPRVAPPIADKLAQLTGSLLVAEAPVEKIAQPVGDWLVRHTRKPEWGIGRVLDESDEGMQVEFENAGQKLVRNVELLEEIK